MNSSRGVARRIPAGIVDAALASLATFAVGLAAVNLLDDETRGIYAIYFTTFMMASVLPRHLIFTPAEVDAVGYPLEERIALIRHTLALGSLPALLGAAAVGLAAVVSSPLVGADVILPLSVTTAGAAFLSPLQDHLRKMLHIAEQSWLAAAVSSAQFVVAVAAVALLTVLDTPAVWIPFGSLFAANLFSLSLGWLLTIRSHGVRVEAPKLGTLARRGGWLVLQAAIPSATGFVAATVITRLAGAEALGFAEAARVVAQPVLVFATGLTAVLAPRVMEAAMNRDAVTAGRTKWAYYRLILIAGALYLAVAGWSWALNPMTRVVPSAYDVSGLVAFTIVANVATAAVFLQINELLGARRERSLVRLAAALSPILLIGAATAAATEAFARAIGRLGESVARFALQRKVIRPQYEPIGRSAHLGPDATAS